MNPNSADSAPRVFSPESAAIATRALNSALCCFLLMTTSHAPLDRSAFSLSRCPKIRSRRNYGHAALPRSPSVAYPVAAQFDRLRGDVDPIQASRVLTQDLTFDLEGQVHMVFLF